VNLHDLVTLEPHGPDTFVGVGHPYPWGGLYGGHIVAQALSAAASTVDPEFPVHSLRAYFIQRGDNSQTVRYEVDRIRNGRSFATRRVVARQAVGAILNLEASFQRPEDSPHVSAVKFPTGLSSPDDIESTTWSDLFDRRWIPSDEVPASERDGVGRVAAWMRANTEVGDGALAHQCALAFISDDLPTDAVFSATPEARVAADEGRAFSASLDHTIWFHRPHRADQWHLYEMSCTAFVGGRGLSFGYVFDAGGTHVATVAQETLVRWRSAST
jgi:acyl-CoA thioesterase-2